MLKGCVARGGGSGGFGGGGAGGGGARTYTQEAPFDFSGFDFNDYAEGAGAAGRKGGSGGFRDIFSGIFGGGRQESMQHPAPGDDLEYQVNVGFWQAIKGTEMQLTIPRRELCTNCHGQGFLESPGQCPECQLKRSEEHTSELQSLRHL